LVKLDTNGRDVEIVEKMIKGGVLDYVAVDIKHSLDKYSISTGTEETQDFFDNYEKLRQLLLN
jgi:pyruvate formate lyase activating enzyme